MPSFKIRPVKSIRGEISLAGDKSIAHRSIFISAIAKGKTQIYNFPASRDCLASLRAFRKLGVTISERGLSPYGLNISVAGRGIYGLKKPRSAIYAGESGTTFRLLSGLLSGQPFRASLTAGQSLSRRPMRRVTEPLRRMGAEIKARGARRTAHGATEDYPPMTIKGGRLRGITYRMPVASAQVKSALLLAGLYAEGITRVIEPKITRDHTERMLKDFGADIGIKGKIIGVTGKKELISPGEIHIPADISSAAFFIVAAILLPDSELIIKSVGLNPGRVGAIRVLRRMGADIKIIPDESSAFGSEPAGDIVVKSGELAGVDIKSNEISQMIDELPVLMLASCLARGRTVIYGAQELRVKETDRIFSMLTNLKKLGANIHVSGRTPKYARPQEKIVIEGTSRLKGATVKSFSDHRTAMTMIIAGLFSQGQTSIDDTACIAKSFPGFLEALKSLTL
ncbi:MAG: 3-phosphoshikimate 1-carboxyvinyltransferase [Candidatus Omnitrophota bacterium]